MVGEHTFRATERRIEYREAERVQAKGKAEPVPAFEAVAARSRVSVDRVHGATLVGRRRELDLLEGALERVLEERSCQLVTLVGVPGVGKSRLVYALYEAIERLPELIWWRQGRCLPYGEGVTFWALGEMVKAQAGILEDDDPSTAARKLVAVAGEQWVESHLRPLVGLAGSGEGGGDARQEAFAAWRRFFEGVAEERPLVLVFEDLHWADDHLLDFVDYLVEWSNGVPLLVVSTARPELLSRRPGWGGGKPNASTISLSPLSDEDTARLVGELLGGLLPAATQVELLARAGGNPLYAEEFVRMLRDRDLGGELPETIQGLIAARLDLLDTGQKTLLQDGAVLGKRFRLGGLASLSGLDRAALETSLHALERKEFLRRERGRAVEGDGEYAFCHVLVRDVAYGQLPRADRAEKHLMAARWIETLGRREDHAEMLAHHYLQAFELTRAAGGDASPFADAARAALEDAGDRSQSLHAYDASDRFYRAALKLAGDGDDASGRLLLRLGRALYRLGEPATAVLEQARDAFVAAGEPEAAIEAQATLCEQLWSDGDSDAAFAELTSARERAEALPSSPAKARLLSVGSRLLMLASEYEEAIRLGEEALTIAEQLGLEEVRAATLDNVGSARLSLGDLERGREQLAAAIEAARAANAPWELVRAMNNLAAHTTWGVDGNLQESTQLHREARAESARYGQRPFVRWQDGVLADRTFELGLWDEAVSLADSFLAEVEDGSPHYLAAQCYAFRAVIRLARDQPDAAVTDIERAVALAERAKDPQLLDVTRARGAHVLYQVGDTKQAARLAGDVLAVMEEKGWVGFRVSASHVAAWTLTALGQGDRLVAALKVAPEVPVIRAALAFARNDPATAADICGGIEAHSQEAYARLVSARSLAEEGRQTEADAQLRRALAFYRSVRATRYEREGERLLAASA